MQDFELLERWRAGDQAAGNELFDRHYDSLFRFLSGKCHGEAADLVQRTLLCCVEARERFRGDCSFRTFMLSIARKELYLHWRKHKRNDDIDFCVSSLQDLGPTPSSVVSLRRKQDLLFRALEAISLDAQIAIELHYWEGLSGPDLARVLDVPEGTVRSRLRRAKDALRAKMAELSSRAEPLSDRELESSICTAAPLARGAAG